MRAVIQRVRKARVTVGDDPAGVLDEPGLCVLVGATSDDTSARARKLADKVHGLRILDGELSARETGCPILVVSQFTLYADTSKGRRPSWSAAAPARQAEDLVNEVIAGLRELGAPVQTGVFGAQMLVDISNDGPMTLIVET